MKSTSISLAIALSAARKGQALTIGPITVTSVLPVITISTCPASLPSGFVPVATPSAVNNNPITYTTILTQPCPTGYIPVTYTVTGQPTGIPSGFTTAVVVVNTITQTVTCPTASVSGYSKAGYIAFSPTNAAASPTTYTTVLTQPCPVCPTGYTPVTYTVTGQPSSVPSGFTTAVVVVKSVTQTVTCPSVSASEYSKSGYIVPSATNGVPASGGSGSGSVGSGTAPAASQRVPAASQDVPAASQSVPAVSQGVPAVSQGVPANSGSAPVAGSSTNAATPFSPAGGNSGSGSSQSGFSAGGSGSANSQGSGTPNSGSASTAGGNGVANPSQSAGLGVSVSGVPGSPSTQPKTSSNGTATSSMAVYTGGASVDYSPDGTIGSIVAVLMAVGILI